MRLGLDHIADLNGYDHILFIATLCAVYQIAQWRRVLILITAFTLGHSLTLALATLDLVRFSTEWIEFLIPLTIFVTAWFNILMRHETVSPSLHVAKYAGALFFGLIHGLGFSNYLRSLLGGEQALAGPLFSFNVGIELGQIIIVGVIMILGYLTINVLGAKRRDWNLVISGAGMGIAAIMMVERFPV